MANEHHTHTQHRHHHRGKKHPVIKWVVGIVLVLLVAIGGYVSTRTLYQPDFKQKRQIIPDTGSRPAGIICRSLYAH